MPIIRCPKGGAAEHVAVLLDKKLRDNLKARNNLFSEGVLGLSSALTRPLLCLFDRNFDLPTALQHTWTYKPMVQDVLGMKLNKVTLVSAEAGPGPSSAMTPGEHPGLLLHHHIIIIIKGHSLRRACLHHHMLVR